MRKDVREFIRRLEATGLTVESTLVEHPFAEAAGAKDGEREEDEDEHAGQGPMSSP